MAFHTSLTRPVTRFACTVLLIAAQSVAGASAPVWLKIRDDNFVIYTDGSQGDLVDYAVRYKAFQLAFRTLFVPAGKPLPPTVLVLFRRYSTFSEYLPSQPNKNDGRTVNYSIESDGVAFTALSLSDGRDKAFERTVQFETIWIMRRIGYDLPVWATQGAGDSLSTARINRGKCLIGELSTEHAHNFSLRSDGFAWPKFFAITHSSPEYNDAKTLWRFDAQSGELMNWILLKDQDTLGRLGQLSRKLRTLPAQRAVEEVMQAPAADFNRLIYEHIARKSTVRELPFDEAGIRASLKVEQASEAEILAQTAPFLSSAGKPERCDGQLARAYLLEPNLPLLREAKARRAMEQNDPDEAVRLYREAIAAGSLNPVAYLRSATARLNGSSPNGVDQAGTGGLNATTAVDEVRRALELNRGNTEAYILLGRAFYLLPKVSDELLGELAGGLTSGEDSWQVRYYYGLLCERLGQPEQCFAEFRKILALPDLRENTRNHVQRQLSYAVYRMNVTKVNALVEGGQFEAARKLITDAQARESEEDVAAIYNKLAAWVKHRAEQL